MNAKKKDIKSLHVLISKEERKAFLVKSKEENSTGSQLIRKWIRQFLKNEKEEPP